MLVALTCTRSDFARYERRILVSLNNFISCFGGQVFFLIIYQDDSRGYSDAPRDFLSSLPKDQVFFKKVSYLSVSRARNDAISYAKSNAFRSIVFHDASLIYTAEYLAWVNSWQGAELLSCGYKFTDQSGFSNSLLGEECVLFKDFYDIFVWSYVFPVQARFPFFDERFGPGKSSIFASGEDFLFMRNFFRLNPEMRLFKKFSGVGILHPSRPRDFSKHLAYAEGQGKIHQVFLLEEKSLYAIWRCILFFGNAMLRVGMIKRNSWRILILRCKGFFDTKTKV